MADVKLELVFKSDHVPRILAAFKNITEQDISLRVGDATNWDWQIPSQQARETSIAFGKRVMKSLVLEVVRCTEYKTDYKRYNEDVKKILVPKQRVEDNIIE